MRRAFAALMIAFAAALPGVARADVLAAGLSTDAIRITSSFRGADVVLFGALATGSRLGALAERDIVVVVTGPDAAIAVRRKQRFAGIWVNAEEATVSGLPGFYYLASTRPLTAIASQATLSKLRLGAANLDAHVAPKTTVPEMTAFRDAAIRGKIRARLYRENGAGVERLGHYLFRVRIRLPAVVAPGRYRAQVFLFNGGKLIARQSTTLPIRKTGLERRLFDYAHHLPFPYGLATVAMALALGWLGFAAFRKR